MPCSISTIIRMETGRSMPTLDVIAQLLSFYGCTVEQVDAHVAMATKPGRTGWLDDVRGYLVGKFPVVTKEYFGYLASESTTTSIRQCRSDSIPTLLQSPAYTAALATAYCLSRGKPDVATAVETLVEVSRHRQKILSPSPGGVEARFLLDEAVVRRVIGTPKDMTLARMRLLEVATYPSVSLRIVPFDAGRPVGMNGSYVIHGGTAGHAGSVTLAHPASMVTTVTKISSVAAHWAHFNTLAELALSEEDSAALVRGLL